MTKAEIEERLEAVAKQEIHFYRFNGYLKLTKKEAEKELAVRIGMIEHIGLFLLDGMTPEYLKLLEFTRKNHKREEVVKSGVMPRYYYKDDDEIEETTEPDDQITFDDILKEEDHD